MKVIVLGAKGFVGRHVVGVLQAQGHELASATGVDMASMLHKDQWLSHVQGMDAVVNAVGVLRDTSRRPLWPTHASGPQALFDACAQVGVQRVVQISALGIAASETAYARSKRVADTHLLSLHEQGRLQAVVLRPSVVVGPGGASSQLFLMLSKWPWLMLPKPVALGLVQPLHVSDLAQAVAQCLDPHRERSGCLELAGPQVFTLRELMAHWRAAQGLAPARVALMPDALSRFSARVGDFLPFTPWCSETLALLSSPNVSDSGALADLLGREPLSVSQWPQKTAH